MSLFGNLEGNEKPRGGMMARLRAWRGSFVEDSESVARAGSADPVEPILGASRPVSASHSPHRGTGAPAGSLGAFLRDADVTDVDAFETADGWNTRRADCAEGWGRPTPAEGAMVDPDDDASVPVSAPACEVPADIAADARGSDAHDEVVDTLDDEGAMQRPLRPRIAER